MNINLSKIHSLHSLLKVSRTKLQESNKLVLNCNNNSITKSKILKILKQYISVDIIKINSLNINKKRKIVLNKSGINYAKVYSIIKNNKLKRFIVTFKHTADRSLFLNEIGMS